MTDLTITDKESSTPTAMAQALVATAQQEIQGALILARRFPRDQGAALKRIESACANPYVAETAEYSYTKGGTEITGPTIRLLEVIKQNWGNLRGGIKVTHRGAAESHATAYAWDLETNDYHEITFVVQHWRDTKKGGYAITDEREIYELVANYGSRRYRKCLETVIPRHIIHAALQSVEKTLEKGGDLATRRAKVVEEFKKYGVTVDQIEKRIGKKIVAASNPEMNSLGRIANSLRDGMSKVEEWFESNEPQKITDLSKPVANDNDARAMLAKAWKAATDMGANPLDILRAAIPNAKLTQADVDKATPAIAIAYAEVVDKWTKENTP